MTSVIDYPEAGVEQVQAAAEHGFNSYQQSSEDYPAHPELMEQPQEVAPPVSTDTDRNFAALRSEVDRIKADRDQERRDHQLQLEMLRANLTAQPRPQERAKEMFHDADPTHLPNVAELRAEMASREQAYQQRLEELEFQTLHPDYAEVLEKYTAPLVKQKPHLTQGILASPQRNALAYEIGKLAQQLQQQAPAQAPQVNQNAQRMVENSRRPGSLSQAPGQSVLSKADYYASMSDADFMKIANRHLESI